MNRSVEGFNPEPPVRLLMWTQLVAAPGVCAELFITVVGLSLVSVASLPSRGGTLQAPKGKSLGRQR